MGRSVSYATGAQVVTFRSMSADDNECGQCEGTGTTDATGEDEECPVCDGDGTVDPDSDDYAMDIEDFQTHLKSLFPSVNSCDEWLGNEDHVLAENRLARFGMSEYCGLLSYWIVPKENGCYSDEQIEPLAKRWIASIADKFVAAFGEMTKIGSMSNGEGVYRRIDRN